MGSIEALQVDPSAFDYDTLRYTLARHSQWSQVDEKVLIHFTHYILDIAIREGSPCPDDQRI